MKTVFTRAERAELEKLIDTAFSLHPARFQTQEEVAIHDFLDRYTEEAIPEHILACARYYVSQPAPRSIEFSCSMALAFGADVWDRAIAEVRNENPDA